MLEIGDTIEGFEVLAHLGEGATSRVYKSRHPVLGFPVALKVLSVADASANQLKRFRREAQLASRLNHENIARIYSFHSSKSTNQLCIAYEFVEGQTLASLMKEGRKFSPEEVVSIFCQLCSALQHAHDQGVIHRDLKPANIMLTGSGEVKLLDFGAGQWCIPCENQQLTGTSEIVGTPAYMSPEQCQGLDVDSRSDLYSAGCVLYALIENRLPFEADTSAQMLLKHVSSPPAKMVSCKSARIAKITDRLLNKDPQKRFSSAAELATALRDAGSEPESPGSTRRMAPVLLIAVCLLITASVAIFFFRPADSKRTISSSIQDSFSLQESSFIKAIERGERQKAQELFDKYLSRRGQKEQVYYLQHLIRARGDAPLTPKDLGNERLLVGLDRQIHDGKNTFSAWQAMIDVCTDDISENKNLEAGIENARLALDLALQERKKKGAAGDPHVFNHYVTVSALTLWNALHSAQTSEGLKHYEDLAEHLNPHTLRQRDENIYSNIAIFWMSYSEALLKLKRLPESAMAATNAADALMHIKYRSPDTDVLLGVSKLMSVAGNAISNRKRDQFAKWIKDSAGKTNFVAAATGVLYEKSDLPRARRIFEEGIVSLGPKEYAAKAGLYHRLFCLSETVVPVKEKVVFATKALEQCQLGDVGKTDAYAEITCYKFMAEALSWDGQIEKSLHYYDLTMKKIEHWLSMPESNLTSSKDKMMVLIQTRLSMAEVSVLNRQLERAAALLRLCKNDLSVPGRLDELDARLLSNRLEQLKSTLEAARAGSSNKPGK